MERIAKYIASCGVTSRRKAEEMVTQKKVKVNGAIITNVATNISPEKDRIEVNGVLLSSPEAMYLMLNKPKNVVTTLEDRHAQHTMLDCLNGLEEKVVPVGRLDKNTTGLLLLTNNGELTYRLTHPSFKVVKTYEAIINKELLASDRNWLERGIALEEGTTLPAEIAINKIKGGKTYLEIKIKEGKKRQIRRMFEALGYKVQELKRTAFGPLILGHLRMGSYRKLTVREIAQLKRAVGL